MQIIFKLSLFLLFSTLLFATAPKITSTMSMMELNKLTASDGAAGDSFSSSVAISGDTAVIGALTDYNGADIGSAYIYTRDSSTGLFQQTAKLTASDGETHDYFGFSVAISGDTIVVGARNDSNGNGSVYIYEKPTNTDWVNATQTDKLVVANNNGSFGYCVAISGDTIVVGEGSGINSIGNYSGLVHIYIRDSSTALFQQTAKLAASDGENWDYFGRSVVISGDTIVVGAHGHDHDNTGDYTGAVYIYEKPTSGDWVNSNQETAKLLSSDHAEKDYFGDSVAISGDTIVVGASKAEGLVTNSGSVYIFEKPVEGWVNSSQESAKLLSSDGADNDWFGRSVAISGDVIVVGSYGDDYDDYDENDDYTGAVYIYEKPTSGDWVNSSQETAKIISSDLAEWDSFGNSIAISGDTIVVGASGNTDSGSAYIFKSAITQNSIENKKDILEVQASDPDGDPITFSILDCLDSTKLAIDTDSGILSFVTAPDYENPSDSNGDNLYEVMIKITDDWAESNIYKAFVSVTDLEYEGKTPNALNFEEFEKLIASDATAGDRFGGSVAISGSTVVVGAYSENSFEGKVYIYEFNSDSNSFVGVASLRASVRTASDMFGYNVSISEDTIVVGTNHETRPVYVFVKPNDGWINATEDAQLTPSDDATGDYFGKQVAISGDTIVASAYFDDNPDTSESVGSAYLFEKPSTGWETATQTAKLTASDMAQYDQFGWSVAISGNTVVIGAIGDDETDWSTGSAYLFEKPLQGWKTTTETAKINASDPLSYSEFGRSVAISGDTIIIGAYAHDSVGAAYLFEKPITGWVSGTEDAKFTALNPNVESGDRFGGSVAISGSTIVIGNSFSGPDSAYLFEKPASGWVSTTETKKLTASDAVDNDSFSGSVAISGDTVLIGSLFDDCTDESEDCGSAYIFKTVEDDGEGINPSIIMYLLN